MRGVSLVFFLLVTLLVVSCAPAPIPTDKPVIAATFFPLAEITRNIVGSTATVYSIVPPGVEPHDYEPTPGDLAQFHRATAFVTLGFSFSHIEQTLIDSRSDPPMIIAPAAGLALLAAAPGEAAEGATADPHVWLSPKNMILMTRTVQQSLAARYPENAQTYEENAEAYIMELENLDLAYRAGLDVCVSRTLLVNHQAFGYLARDYNLQQIAISGISPEAEPTPGDLAELIEQARTYNVSTVFTEDLVDPRIAQTIADEVHARTRILSPAESANQEGDTYVLIMQRNLDNLRAGLGCP